jgi:membrane-associated protein
MAFVADYGAIGLAVILAVNCLGVPFPASLLMLAAGALAARGDMDLWPLLGFSLAGAVVGDQGGYALGRWGGQPAIDLAARRFHAGDSAERAARFVHRWGGGGVFFTRWLLSPLGPYVNLASGAVRYPWLRFLGWGAAGEAIWVTGYVGLGHVFSSRVQQVAGFLGDFTWFLVGAALSAGLGYALWKSGVRGIGHRLHDGPA